MPTEVGGKLQQPQHWGGGGNDIEAVVLELNIYLDCMKTLSRYINNRNKPGLEDGSTIKGQLLRPSLASQLNTQHAKYPYT